MPRTGGQPHGSGSPQVTGAALTPCPLASAVPRQEGWHSCGVSLGALIAAVQKFAVPLMLRTLDLPLSVALSCSAGSQQPLLSGTSFYRNRFHEENAMHAFNLPLFPLIPNQ